MTTGADVLEKAAQLFRERNAVYGDNFLRLGNMMHGMFPNGVELKTPQDWTRLYFLFLSVVKISRYSTNFHNGGHNDSSVDASVYMAMLHAFDKDREPLAGKPVLPAQTPERPGQAPPITKG